MLKTWERPEVLDIPGDQSDEPGVGLQAIKHRFLASPWLHNVRSDGV